MTATSQPTSLAYIAVPIALYQCGAPSCADEVRVVFEDDGTDPPAAFDRDYRGTVLLPVANGTSYHMLATMLVLRLNTYCVVHSTMDPTGSTVSDRYLCPVKRGGCTSAQTLRDCTVRLDNSAGRDIDDAYPSIGVRSLLRLLPLGSSETNSNVSSAGALYSRRETVCWDSIVDEVPLQCFFFLHTQNEPPSTLQLNDDCTLPDGVRSINGSSNLLPSQRIDVSLDGRLLRMSLSPQLSAYSIMSRLYDRRHVRVARLVDKATGASVCPCEPIAVVAAVAPSIEVEVLNGSDEPPSVDHPQGGPPLGGSLRAPDGVHFPRKGVTCAAPEYYGPFAAQFLQPSTHTVISMSEWTSATADTCSGELHWGGDYAADCEASDELLFNVSDDSGEVSIDGGDAVGIGNASMIGFTQILDDSVDDEGQGCSDQCGVADETRLAHSEGYGSAVVTDAFLNLQTKVEENAFGFSEWDDPDIAFQKLQFAVLQNDSTTSLSQLLGQESARENFNDVLSTTCAEQGSELKSEAHSKQSDERLTHPSRLENRSLTSATPTLTGRYWHSLSANRKRCRSCSVISQSRTSFCVSGYTSPLRASSVAASRRVEKSRGGSSLDGRPSVNAVGMWPDAVISPAVRGDPLPVPGMPVSYHIQSNPSPYARPLDGISPFSDKQKTGIPSLNEMCVVALEKQDESAHAISPGMPVDDLVAGGDLREAEDDFPMLVTQQFLADCVIGDMEDVEDDNDDDSDASSDYIFTGV